MYVPAPLGLLRQPDQVTLEVSSLLSDPSQSESTSEARLERLQGKVSGSTFKILCCYLTANPGCFPTLSSSPPFCPGRTRWVDIQTHPLSPFIQSYNHGCDQLPRGKDPGPRARGRQLRPARRRGEEGLRRQRSHAVTTAIPDRRGVR